MAQSVFLPYCLKSAAYQMALDEALFLEAENKRDDFPKAIFRFYDFDPGSVTFGCFQKISESPLQVDEKPYLFSRRPTGGGMVKHDNSLTFSIVADSHFMTAFERLDASYCFIHKMIQRTFERIGYSVSLVQNEAKTSDGFRQCFQEPVRSDVMLNDQKIVGGAQKRGRNSFLHQGSIQLSWANKSDQREISEKIQKVFLEIFKEDFLDVHVLERLPEDIEQKSESLYKKKYRNQNWLLKI